MKAVMINPSVLNADLTYERDLFSPHGIEYRACDVRDDAEYIAACHDADVIMVLLQPTPRRVVESLTRCRGIIGYGVGYDHIDVTACNEKRIPVCNIPDYCAQEVAAHSVALALACLRKIAYFDRQVRAGGWDNTAGYGLRRLAGQTFGLCGFGNIARAVAGMVSGFGFTRIGYDPYVGEDVFSRHGVRKVTLEELCKESDIISVHTSLSAETAHLFDYSQFAMMKRGAVLVNTSRGAVVNQAALEWAMVSGVVKAAGLDVLEFTPASAAENAGLLARDDVVVTPHAGVQSAEAIIDLRSRVVETALALLRGEVPANTVNAAVLDSPGKENRMATFTPAGGGR